jgi:hypothetical protein
MVHDLKAPAYSKEASDAVMRATKAAESKRLAAEMAESAAKRASGGDVPDATIPIDDVTYSMRDNLNKLLKKKGE